MLASWTRRGFDTRNRYAADVQRRLLHGLGPRDILLLHDGHAARSTNGQPVILQVLPSLLNHIQQANLETVTSYNFV